MRLLFAVLALIVSGSAAAQDFTDYTVDSYLHLRESLDAADSRLGNVREDDVEGRTEAVDSLISSVHDLIAYLNGWSASGSMPDGLEVEARTQRFVLFENLVQLYSDLGNCQAARSALEAMRILEPASLGPDMAALRWSSQRVVEDCEARPLVVVESVERRLSPISGQVVTALGAAALVAGTTVFGIDAAANRAYQDEVDLQEALGTATRDSALRSENARLQRNRSIARALLATGGAVSASGIVLWSVAVAAPDRAGADIGVSAGLGFGRLHVTF
ncbi:MAG: hypothetical protein ACJAYU_000320 [Bradymonadia bacterium]|jgi:hypothetical protein